MRLHGSIVRALPLAAAFLAAILAVHTLTTDARAATGGRRCPRGVQACSANQVGQPCNPNDLNVICSAQANGGYCCLAYAP